MSSLGTFVMLVAIVVVFVLLITAGSRGRGAGGGGAGPQRGCSHCGALHPHFAEFCRRCGKRLG